MGGKLAKKYNNLTELREADLLLPEKGMFVFTQNHITKQIINRPFRADNFAFFVVTRGSFTIRYNLVSYLITANQIFLGLPDALCELYEVSADLQGTGVVFSRGYLEKQGIQPTVAETVRLFSPELNHQFNIQQEEAASFEIALAALHKKKQLPPQTPFLQEIIKHSFLSVAFDAALVFYRDNGLANIKLTRKEELASRFLTLLADNFKKERSVQYYAGALFITPRHLSQVVKQVTGQTAGEVIDEAVIREAKILLPAKEATVAQVADILGFSDQSFFGKYFKKHTGITPSAYRANSIAVQNPPF